MNRLLRSPTSPSVFWVKRRVVRFVAYLLTGVDAAISYRGFVAVGYPSQESLALTGLILCFQVGVAAWLMSGAPIGKQFNDRFFCDVGVPGAIKRSLGMLILILGAGFYVADVVSNYWALTVGWEGRAIFHLPAVIMAIALAVGDEVLAVIADFLDITAPEVEVSHRNQSGAAELDIKYQQAYQSKAKQVAEVMGSEHGMVWHPRREVMRHEWARR